MMDLIAWRGLSHREAAVEMAISGVANRYVL